VLERATVTHQLSGQCVGAGAGADGCRRCAMAPMVLAYGQCMHQHAHNHEMCDSLLAIFGSHATMAMACRTVCDWQELTSLTSGCDEKQLAPTLTSQIGASPHTNSPSVAVRVIVRSSLPGRSIRRTAACIAPNIHRCEDGGQ
jgi:hypothetical protein